MHMGARHVHSPLRICAVAPTAQGPGCTCAPATVPHHLASRLLLRRVSIRSLVRRLPGGSRAASAPRSAAMRTCWRSWWRRRASTCAPRTPTTSTWTTCASSRSRWALGGRRLCMEASGARGGTSTGVADTRRQHPRGGSWCARRPQRMVQGSGARGWTMSGLQAPSCERTLAGAETLCCLLMHQHSSFFRHPPDLLPLPARPSPSPGLHAARLACGYGHGHQARHGGQRQGRGRRQGGGVRAGGAGATVEAGRV